MLVGPAANVGVVPRGSRRYLVPVRAAYLAVNRIPGMASLVHRLPVGRLRRRLRADVRGRDVIEILDALAAAGVRAWLVGGWGIDALVGTQTRDHEDVDVCVDTTDVGA